MRVTGRSSQARSRGAFTLLEMLTVVAIIALLVALMVPALAAARGYARSIQCRNNLRQIGIGLVARGESSGAYCSGAFSWRYDGCVVEKGWVADLVQREIPVGQLLCPGSDARLGETIDDLLTMTDADFDPTLYDSGTQTGLALGSPEGLAPDGRKIKNPCRLILEGNGLEMPVPGPLSPARVKIIQEQILDKFYNTNYTASWYLVRAELNLNAHGNLVPRVPTSWTDANPNTLTDNPIYTRGPLAQSMITHINTPQSLVPLLGCGRAMPSKPLAVDIGAHRAGQPLVRSHTRGPRLTASMTAVPKFAEPTPREGENGWWKVWARDTLQDFTDFAPVHRGSCNILFLDGSVRSFDDNNRDGVLNNGFAGNSEAVRTPFADATIELGPTAVASYFSLFDKNLTSASQ